jgi:hypothetical protein
MRRRARRRRDLAAGLAVVMIVAVAGLGLSAGLGAGQRVESSGRDPSTSSPEISGTTSSLTVSAESSNDAASQDANASGAGASWRLRWFLVPPEPIEIRELSSRDEFWEKAQGAIVERTVVTTDRSDPATAGLAWVYHLEGASIFRIGDPNWAYREKTVAGREVRIGDAPAGDSINAYAASESGAFVVVGVRMTEPQVVDLALAARLVNGQVELGERLPNGFEVIEAPSAAASDNRSATGWVQDGESWTLTVSPSSVEDAQLRTRHFEVESMAVRGTTGVYIHTVAGQTPATLIWAEHGHVISLAPGDDRAPGDPRRMVAVANLLQEVNQSELVERLGDRFTVRQADTVAEWLRATPPPAGWDTSPLIDFVPQGELQMAGRTRQFLECAWLAEWADAVRASDESRRDEAQTTLANETQWPVLSDELRAQETMTGDTATLPQGERQVIDERTEQLAAAETDTDVAQIEELYGCGFVSPN